MAKPYTIRPGESFRQPDGAVLTGGDTIELDDDMAALHAGKVDLAGVPAEVPAEPIPQPLQA